MPPPPVEPSRVAAAHQGGRVRPVITLRALNKDGQVEFNLRRLHFIPHLYYVRCSIFFFGGSI